MPKATVAVILSNYNHARYLPDSLGGICSQTRPADEIVVIDDGSTDDSVAVIGDFARSHPAIRFLRNERNLGLQASIARALPLVTAEYLVWAAADDRLLPDFLARSMAALERHPQAGLCFSELSVLQGDTEVVQRFAAEPSVAHIFDLSDLPEFMTSADIVRRMKRAYLPITSNSVVVRRDALLSSGGYLKELEWYADSFAYTVVALRHGACVVPETLALIRAHPGSYSGGMHDPSRQAEVLAAMLDVLARPAYRDIRRVFRRCPSNFSIGLTLMLKLQMRRARDWDLFFPYLVWKIKEYKRGHRLGWLATCARLGARGLRAMWGHVRPRALARYRISRFPVTVVRVGRRIARSARPALKGAAPSPTSPQGAYTLVITTFNRALLLSRLLGYLEREGADFPVLILDSSGEEARGANAGRIAASGLAIRHLVYPSDLHPYLKVGEGVRQVQTRYCSLCADDDLVLLPALRHCLEVLDRMPDVCAAHGSYVNFAEAEYFDLTYIVYRSPSLLVEDPVRRLGDMFAAYEAVYYAVYRTPVLQEVFRRVGELRTVLGRELLTAALTAIAGKVVRIDDFYYGRSTGPSAFFENWHPHQILASSPELLFREYRRLRGIVLQELRGHEHGDARAGLDGRILDLIFLRYLAPFLRRDVIDVIINDQLKGMTPEATVEHLWDSFVYCGVRTDNPTEPLLSPGGSGFAPDRHPGAEFRRPTDYTLRSDSARNGPRTYRVRYEFLFPELKPPALVGKESLTALLDRLDSY